MRVTATALISSALALACPMVGAYLTDTDTQVTYGMYLDLYPAAAYSTTHDEYVLISVQDRTAEGGDVSLLGQRVDGQTGVRVGNSFIIDDIYSGFDSSEHGPPDISYSPGDDVYLAVWGASSMHHIYGRLIAGTADTGDSGGQLIGSQFDICHNLSSDARNPRVAFDTEHGQFLVVWADDRDSDLSGTHWAVFGQLIDAEDGSLIGGEIRITPEGEEGWWPDADYSPPGDHYLVVWARSAGTGRSHRARRVGHDGSLVGSAFSISRTDAVNRRRPGVSYWAGMSRFLVAHSANDYAMGQVVAGTAGGGDGGGQLIGDALTLGPASQGSLFDADHVPGLGLWLVAWNFAGGYHYKRGCLLDSDGVVRVDDFAIDTGIYYANTNTVVATHSTMGPDLPRVFHTTFSGLEGDVMTRSIPQILDGAEQGEMENCDFLRVNTDPGGWNMISARPVTGDDVDMRIFPNIRFFWGDHLAESEHQDPGRAEIIAVNGAATGAETLNVLFETSHVDPVYYRAEHAVSRGNLSVPSDETQMIGVGNSFIHSWTLDVALDEHCVINVIPSGDQDFNLAVFETRTTTLPNYIGLDDLESVRYVHNGFTPGWVETAYLVGQRTGSVGVAVWTAHESGQYRLVVRDPDEPTTDEIVRHLLGLASTPWPAGSLNGDGVWDAADLVLNIEAGR